MTLDELKVIIDLWEDGYLTGRTYAEDIRLHRALDAPALLTDRLDHHRACNLAAMREGCRPDILKEV